MAVKTIILQTTGVVLRSVSYGDCVRLCLGTFPICYTRCVDETTRIVVFLLLGQATSGLVMIMEMMGINEFSTYHMPMCQKEK